MTIYKEALDYHSNGRKGKIEVIPCKPVSTQQDLSLAYSPGVAEPCRMIAEKEELVYEYTSKGNLVAVISNGTAVLGLGNIGPRRKTGHGRKSDSIQEICRYRCFRYRAKRPRILKMSSGPAKCLSLLWRNQLRGHQSA